MPFVVVAQQHLRYGGVGCTGPQKVPEWIIERLHAVKPEELLGAPIWPRLVSARNRRVGRSCGCGRLREQLTAVTGIEMFRKLLDEAKPVRTSVCCSEV